MQQQTTGVRVPEVPAALVVCLVEKFAHKPRQVAVILMIRGWVQKEHQQLPQLLGQEYFH
jgi:hypothetical protein